MTEAERKLLEAVLEAGGATHLVAHIRAVAQERLTASNPGWRDQLCKLQMDVWKAQHLLKQAEKTVSHTGLWGITERETLYATDFRTWLRGLEK